MARTTIDLEPGLIAELKHLAAEASESTSRTVNRLLRQALARARSMEPSVQRFRWKVAKAGRPAAGFDPATRDYLDLLDDKR